MVWYNSPFYNKNLVNIYEAIRYYDSDFVIPSNKSWNDILLGDSSMVFYEQWLNPIFFEIPSEFFKILFFYDIYPIKMLFWNRLFLLSSSLITFILVFISYFLYSRSHQKTHDPDSLDNNHKSKKVFISIVLISIVLYILIISMGFIKKRFLYPILPLLVAPLIYSLNNLMTFILNKIKIISEKYSLKIGNFFSTKHQKSFFFLVLIMSPFIFFQFSASFHTISWQHENERVEFKITGEFLNDRIEENDIIVVRKQNYLYYMKFCRYRSYPSTNNLTQFFNELRSTDYLIVAERMEVQFRPDLGFLLNTSSEIIPNYINPIFQYNKTNRKIVIYEVLPN